MFLMPSSDMSFVFVIFAKNLQYDNLYVENVFVVVFITDLLALNRSFINYFDEPSWNARQEYWEA